MPAISSITMAGTAGMLAALPAHSLTQLRLTELMLPVDGAAVSAALARLSNLQQLYLDDPNRCRSFLAALPQLQQLTQLEVDCGRGDVPWDELASTLHQLAAQAPPLRVLRLPDARCDGLLDLSRWTQLQIFSSVDEFKDEGEFDVVLPPQLQELKWGPLSSAVGYEALLSLRQLRSLSFEVKAAVPDALLRLAQLPALQQLSLQIYYPDLASAAAAVWPQLPQLRELELHLSDQPPTSQQWAAICGGLAGCTGLTKLRLCAAEQAWAQDVGWYLCSVEACAILAGLTRLRDLNLFQSRLAPGDALALTALTGLARLELSNVRDGVGELAATAIASSCRQLRHLDLRACDLGSMGCLAVVRHLTQLRALDLRGNGKLTQQGLMLLTRLKQLQQLRVDTDNNAEVTDQLLQSFWAAVRQ